VSDGFFQARPELCRFLDANTQKAGLALFLDLTPLGSGETLLAYRYRGEEGGPELALTLTQVRMNGQLRLFIHSEIIHPNGERQNLTTPLWSIGWDAERPEFSTACVCALLQRVLRAWRERSRGTPLQRALAGSGG